MAAIIIAVWKLDPTAVSLTRNISAADFPLGDQRIDLAVKKGAGALSGIDCAPRDCLRKIVIHFCLVRLLSEIHVGCGRGSSAIARHHRGRTFSGSAFRMVIMPLSSSVM